jgi:pimeloyl-ACP methyl ester carboxylesterase
MRSRVILIALMAALVGASPMAQAPAAPPDRFFDSAGVRLRYVEQGSGPAVVLMHGYTGTADRHFLANGVFANLATDHRAIAIDLRGHGKAASRTTPQPTARRWRATWFTCWTT